MRLPPPGGTAVVMASTLGLGPGRRDLDLYLDGEVVRTWASDGAGGPAWESAALLWAGVGRGVGAAAVPYS